MQKKIAIPVLIFLSVLVLSLCGLSWWLYQDYVSPEESAVIARAAQLETELSAANGEIDARGVQIAVLNEEAEALRAEIVSNTEQIETLKEKISVLLNSSEAQNEYQAILLEELALLQAQLAEQEAQIAQLDELIGQYENITTLNFGYQAKKISDLWVRLTEPNRPIRTIVTEEINEETGETVETVTEQPAKIAFYYHDITTGYTLTYNSDELMYSASLIKVPYVYAMLRAVTEFEYQKLHYAADGTPLYDEEGNPLFEGAHPNLDENGQILYAEGEEKYDLSRVWTFDKDTMTVEGSGIICECESGFQLTYLELAEYALKYSDNIAFAQLRKMFGYTEYYATARSLGVRGSSHGFMQLSADDCGIFLEAIYTFIEENEKYGSVMRDAMVGSKYPYMIANNVLPAECAHKYGWDEDSYHDMAIVYDEHPYILVLLTDLDTGGSEVNSYIAGIVRAIRSIHSNFYS